MWPAPDQLVGSLEPKLANSTKFKITVIRTPNTSPPPTPPLEIHTPPTLNQLNSNNMVETTSPPSGLTIKRCPSSPLSEQHHNLQPQQQQHHHNLQQLQQQHLQNNLNSINNQNLNNNNNNTPRQSPRSPATPNAAYLTTAMLLNSQQCGYLGQRLQSVFQQQQQQQHQHTQSQTPSSDDGSQSGATIIDDDRITLRETAVGSATATAAAAASIFSIDSILGSRSVNNNNNNSNNINNNLINQKRSESPTSPSSNSSSAASSPLRPQRVPAMLQHPGLHLGHLAAAAASGFAASPSDFLGKFWFLCLRGVI